MSDTSPDSGSGPADPAESADPAECAHPAVPAGDAEHGAPGRRRGLVVVAALVGVVVLAAAVVAAVRATDDDGRSSGEAAADAFVEAYTRHLDATFRVEGETTRTLEDGRTLSSAYLVVQRPPDRIQRALGSTTGEVGGRIVNCSVDADGTYRCAPGADAEPWPEQRATVLDALDSYVRGDDPVYATEVDGSGCFVLTRRRTEPDATFGLGARLCFDERYGALRRLEVEREGGATDVMLADRITDAVTGADFDLGEDSTYDPVVPEATGTAPPTSS